MQKTNERILGVIIVLFSLGFLVYGSYLIYDSYQKKQRYIRHRYYERSHFEKGIQMHKKTDQDYD